jgi:adenine-specific DNA-methyltransferase
MDKLKMHSPDLTADNIDKIREIFPSCVTEARDEDGKLRYAVDFDQLRQELSDHVVEGPQERYRLDWPGKREALLAANAPIGKTLRPVPEDSSNFDTTRNLFIEGDNLDALKLLQETYIGLVRLIYIDPPYNTGSDFVYDDDYSESSQEFFSRSMQVDVTGNRLVANLESNGRFHSDWMSMLYSRLRLSRNLLSRDGVILVSIGPEELKNLLAMMGDIFGEKNVVSVLTWEKGRKNDSTFFSDSAEYMVIFARDKEHLAQLGKWRERKEGVEKVFEVYNSMCRKHGSDHSAIELEMKKFYRALPDEAPEKKLSHFSRSDDRGLYFGDNISSASTSIPDYEIIHPTTGKPVKKPTRGWGATEPVMLERIREDRVLFGPDETTIPLKKSYLVEVDSAVKTPVLYKDGRAASGVIKSLFGDVVFNNPKDHEILSDVFSYCLQDSIDSIFLDFFAGSGSTSHAVLSMNAADGGSRKFIAVQIPEELDVSTATSPAAKVTIQKATKFLDSIGKPKNIAEISKERIRRAGMKILGGKCHPDWDRDIGFRVLKIDSSNMADVHYAPGAVAQGDLLAAVDNIKPGRDNPEDLLFQVLVDWGVNLTLPIRKETIQGKTVFFVSDEPYDLIACFDRGIDDDFVKELAGHHPMRMVFRDNGFTSDAAKINAGQIFKQLSPETEVKTI